jgi:hypothetical protein
VPAVAEKSHDQRIYEKIHAMQRKLVCQSDACYCFSMTVNAKPREPDMLNQYSCIEENAVSATRQGMQLTSRDSIGFTVTANFRNQEVMGIRRARSARRLARWGCLPQTVQQLLHILQLFNYN